MTVNVKPFSTTLQSKIAQFWTLIKPLQTGLLLATGVAGFMSAHGSVNIPLLLVMSASLFLSISGSTIMNMWWDHDIDAKMKRTQKRPAASPVTAAWCTGWKTQLALFTRTHWTSAAAHAVFRRPSAGRWSAATAAVASPAAPRGIT